MKKCGILAIVLIFATVSLIVPFYFDGFVVLGENSLRKFSSYGELKSLILENVRARRNLRGTLYLTSPQELRSLDTNLETYSLLSPDYSKTNTQVEGVDEADTVKTDGECIYAVSGRNVTILKAYPPEEAEILSQITLNGTIHGLFISGDKMVVFEGGYESRYNPYHATFALSSKSFHYYEMPCTYIRVYNVSNRAHPVSTRNVTMDGYYCSSRMIGDYVYAVINVGAYAMIDVYAVIDERVYIESGWVSLPKICYDGEVKEIPANEIYYSTVSDTLNTYTTILSVNVQNDEQEPTHETILLGTTSNIYVSMNNIYVTFSGYIGEQIRSNPRTGMSFVSFSMWGTIIQRVLIENGDIEIGPSGSVIGNVLNQFSMDEYNGYFRIATTNWGQGSRQNNVYVLDMDLYIVGRLENFAPPDETMDSARFIGDRCYLSTSVIRRDPFFVIDLANPTEPKVLGYLKIPGFTRYLHPYDENLIIGVGKDGNIVKISLFDVSNVSKPIEMDKYMINGTWSDTPVLSEHKAFLFSKVKNLLAFPVSVRILNNQWQGVYIFNITLPEGFVLRGKITHLGYSVERSLYIDNVLYTISSKKIKMNSLEDLAEINEIKLP